MIRKSFADERPDVAAALIRCLVRPPRHWLEQTEQPGAGARCSPSDRVRWASRSEIILRTLQNELKRRRRGLPTPPERCYLMVAPQRAVASRCADTRAGSMRRWSAGDRSARPLIFATSPTQSTAPIYIERPSRVSALQRPALTLSRKGTAPSLAENGSILANRRPISRSIA